MEMSVSEIQSLTRKVRLDNIKSEIAILQDRINSARSQPSGSVDVQALLNQEAALKQHLFESL